jgi:hypothetical protein
MIKPNPEQSGDGKPRVRQRRIAGLQVEVMEAALPGKGGAAFFCYL